MFKRRDFLKATSAAALTGPLLDARSSEAPRPQRIAIVASIWEYLSHA